MTLKPLVSTLLALVFASTAFAADFEGTLEMTMTAGKRVSPMTMFLKPGKMRFEMQASPTVTSVGLIDATSGDMTILMVEQKMYMTIAAKKVGAAAPSDVTFEETGRTETIAGKKCTEFVLKDKKTTTEVWATSELGGFTNLAEAFGRRGQRSAWEEEMVRRGMFSLRVISRNKKGAEISRMECTTITEKKLDDELFKIPEGFTKMPGLGDLFGR